MGIYRIPPSPFVGGWQPLAPRKLPPSDLAVQVDDPPFTGSARPSVQLATILQAWIPPPPQPQVAWKLNPALEAVPDDQPPPTSWRWLSTVLFAWQPGPPQPQVAWRVSPAILAVPADSPPFGQHLWLSGTLQMWQPLPPPPQRGLQVVPPPSVVAAGGLEEKWTLGTEESFTITVNPALGGRGSS